MFKQHLIHQQGPSLHRAFLLILTNATPNHWTILIRTNLPNKATLLSHDYLPLPADTTALEQRLAMVDCNNNTQDTSLDRSPVVHTPSIIKHRGDTYKYGVAILTKAMFYLHHDSPLIF